MIKNGVRVTLPVYLQNSEKYPAFVTNSRWKLITCNNFLKNICGNNHQQAAYLKDIFSPDEVTVIKHQTSLLSSRPVASAQTTINNHTISWEISIFEAEGPLFLFVGAVQFIKPADNIPLRENHFSVFMNNSPALMWATDTEGRIVIMNKKYKEETGFESNGTGKVLWDVFPKELADRFKKNDELVIQRNGLMEMEETSVDKFGRKREYLVYKFPLQTAEYGVVVAGWSVDITELKNANKQLLHQNNRFKQIARLQSHAVRRPLANILGLIDLVHYYEAQGDFAEVSAMISLLKQSSADLDAIIKKIVFKAGVFKPELETIS